MSEAVRLTPEKNASGKVVELPTLTDKGLKPLVLGEGEKIALVGNPNVGKSVIFGALTGRYVTVSNYPGTTVEVSRGSAKIEGRPVEIIDTPGAGSLVPMSEDECVTRDILLNGDVGRVIQVADSKNLERSLSMSLQIAETGLPFVLALNMTDEASSRGIEVDAEALGKLLGAEAVKTVATRHEGIDKLRHAIARAEPVGLRVEYDARIEAAVSRVELKFEGHPISARSLALMFLAGDQSMAEWAKENLSKADLDLIERTYHELQSEYRESLGYVMARIRWKAAEAMVEKAVRKTGAIKPGAAKLIGDLMMHRVWGWLVLVGVLFITYEFVGRLGAQILVNILEKNLFGHIINPALTAVVGWLLPWSFAGIIRDALVGDYGMLTVALTYSVAIILPIVSTFFIIFGLLEDTGYLPRLAVMSNQFFKKMGLNGKAVLPMVLGLGCGTMAALTSRIMETRKERILVILLLALGVPCSAQLGVILGMLHGVGIAGTFIWVGVVVGVMFFVGYIAAKIIPGRGEEFVLELPPVRMPQISNILIKTVARIEWYLKEAVPLFMLGTFVLFALDRSGMLTYIEAGAAPIVKGWLHMPVKATEAFIVGFLRRDYGAAGLYGLQQAGQLDHIGVIVGLVTITLFVPCIANFFIIIKELGLKAAFLMSAFIFPFAFFVGGVLNLVLRGFHVQF